MRNVLRVVVAIVGLFNIVIGIGFLVDPARSGSSFFLTSVGTQGLATMRADLTAFFVTGGVFALVGAWRAWGRPLQVPIMLLSIAFVGRLVSLIADGTPPTAFPPMIAEAVMIALLGLGWRSFAPVPRASDR